MLITTAHRRIRVAQATAPNKRARRGRRSTTGQPTARQDPLEDDSDSDVMEASVSEPLQAENGSTSGGTVRQ